MLVSMTGRLTPWVILLYMCSHLCTAYRSHKEQPHRCRFPLQGPQLEQEGLQVGVVTAIAAPAALRVSFSGGLMGGCLGAVLAWAGQAAEAARL